MAHLSKPIRSEVDSGPLANLLEHDDLLPNILKFLDTESVENVGKVCKGMSGAINTRLWRDFGASFPGPLDQITPAMFAQNAHKIKSLQLMTVLSTLFHYNISLCTNLEQIRVLESTFMEPSYNPTLIRFSPGQFGEFKVREPRPRVLADNEMSWLQRLILQNKKLHTLSLLGVINPSLSNTRCRFQLSPLFKFSSPESPIANFPTHLNLCNIYLSAFEIPEVDLVHLLQKCPKLELLEVQCGLFSNVFAPVSLDDIEFVKDIRTFRLIRSKIIPSVARHLRVHTLALKDLNLTRREFNKMLSYFPDIEVLELEDIQFTEEIWPYDNRSSSENDEYLRYTESVEAFRKDLEDNGKDLDSFRFEHKRGHSEMTLGQARAAVEAVEVFKAVKEKLLSALNEKARLSCRAPN
ncbi:hypothetical protein BGZ94_002118 [Podila epigama]|nr:hypothetical protein BGZ94_002118 [Podila epigama]